MKVKDILKNSSDVPKLASQLDTIEHELSPFLKTNKILYFAHRGAEFIAPENTIPAYQYAKKCGFDGAETDIVTTSDGHWYLMHDDTLDRTTTGTGYAWTKTKAYIEGLSIKDGANISLYPNLKVPFLDDYLSCCKELDSIPVIQIKHIAGSNYDNFIASLRKYNLEDKCMMISFFKQSIEEVRKRSSKVHCQLLTASITQTEIDYCKSIKNCSIASNNINLAIVNLCHSNGVKIGVYTLDSVDSINQALGYGVDFVTSGKYGGVQ